MDHRGSFIILLAYKYEIFFAFDFNKKEMSANIILKGILSITFNIIGKIFLKIKKKIIILYTYKHAHTFLLTKFCFLSSF